MSHLNRVEAYAKGRSNFSLADAAASTQGSETGTAARLRDLRQLGYTVTVEKVKGTKVRLYSVSNVRLAVPTSAERAAKQTVTPDSLAQVFITGRGWTLSPLQLQRDYPQMYKGIAAIAAHING